MGCIWQPALWGQEREGLQGHCLRHTNKDRGCLPELDTDLPEWGKQEAAAHSHLDALMGTHPWMFLVRDRAPRPAWLYAV